MKKRIVILLFVGLLLANSISIASSNFDLMDGHVQIHAEVPVTSEWLPFRVIWEYFGYKVLWNKTTKIMTATKGNDSIIINPQKNLINWANIDQLIEVKVINNTIMIEPWLIREVLSKDIIKDGKKLVLTDAISDESQYEQKNEMIDLKNDFYVEKISNKLYKEMLNVSLFKNSIVSRDDLLLVHVGYYGFDNLNHRGELIVSKKVADDVVQIFKELYQNKFPIEKIKRIDAYNANDELSMRDNNTSAFCDRIINGTTSKSLHARGLAIDINPLYNPYYNYKNKRLLPYTAAKYMNREAKIKGMIKANSIAVKIFEKYGWKWGGKWSSVKDYQHFEKAN